MHIMSLFEEISLQHQDTSFLNCVTLHFFVDRFHLFKTLRAAYFCASLKKLLVSPCGLDTKEAVSSEPIASCFGPGLNHHLAETDDHPSTRGGRLSQGGQLLEAPARVLHRFMYGPICLGVCFGTTIIRN